MLKTKQLPKFGWDQYTLVDMCIIVLKLDMGITVLFFSTPLITVSSNR